jgi:hypothetical protein
MSRVLFSNAALLAGLAALAIPILIHLFLKRRRLRLRFSTLQFFTQQDEKSGRRRKLLNWLLLATRVLLLALVVAAFARPYLPDSPASQNNHIQQRVVFVLDRSASMQVADAGSTRWSKAKDIVLKALGEMGLDDRVALVECASRATTLSQLVPPPKLKPQIEQLQPGFGAGDVGDGLQEAVKLLSAKDVRGHLSIYLISDLQRQSCQKLDSSFVPQNIELKILPVGETNTPNIAVSDLTLETGKTPLQATVANFSDHDATETALTWVIDGHSTPPVPVVLAAHGTTNVTGALPILQSGWHQIEARLPSHDSFVLDDVRESSFFLVSALQPGRDETNAPPSLFDIEKISPDALVGKLTGVAASPYKIVLLPALRQLPEGCGQALLEFARHGGGVLLFVDNGLGASQYDGELGGLLPATLDRIEGESLTFENYWRLHDFDSNSTVFSAFRNPRSGDLTLPEFWRRYALTPGDSARVLARFRDAAPFIVSREIGQGRVLLVNTSADTSWSDWPKHKTFVPWLHGACHYLAGDELSLGPRPENSWVAGTLAEIKLGATHGNQELSLHPPAGADFPVKSDDQGQVEFPLDSPGFYSLLDSSRQTIRVLAVNPPQRESDLAAFTSSEFQTQLVRSQAMPETGFMTGMLAPVDGGKSLWRILMLAGALFLVLETVLANRTFA